MRGREEVAETTSKEQKMGFIPVPPPPDLHPVLREQLPGNLGEEGICNGNACWSEALGASTYPVFVCLSPSPSIHPFLLGKVLGSDPMAP